MVQVGYTAALGSVYPVETSTSLYNLYIFFLLTVVDCGNLTNPANGQVSHTAGTTFEQTATYSCDTGFNLMGDTTRTCQATGVWSGNAPTCQGTAAGHSVIVNSISGTETVNKLQ